METASDLIFEVVMDHICSTPWPFVKYVTIWNLPSKKMFIEVHCYVFGGYYGFRGFSSMKL